VFLRRRVDGGNRLEAELRSTPGMDGVAVTSDEHSILHYHLDAAGRTALVEFDEASHDLSVVNLGAPQVLLTVGSGTAEKRNVALLPR
jgi:hypothetical protein